MLTVALGGLEAGLEDLVLSAHAYRLGRVGQPITDKLRDTLVGRPLQAPNETKLENLLLMSFGLELTTLPHPGFEILRKGLAHGGAGQPQAGPTNWQQLRLYFKVLSRVRNATAHGELSAAAKPTNCSGTLWVETTTAWSIQQPHATSGLRATVEIYNTAACALAGDQGFTFSHPLRRPEAVVPA